MNFNQHDVLLMTSNWFNISDTELFCACVRHIIYI